MNRIEAALIVGARPQFIKAAAIHRAVEKIQEEHDFQSTVVHTGQHYDPDLSDRLFEDLGLPDPRYHLEVGSASHATQTAQILERTEAVLMELSPDVAIVMGDTNSTLGGALAAAKLQIPIAHVEAGLRSFDMRMAEEINRKVTDHLSTWLYCPSEAAKANLQNEGITQDVQVVGDVMLDVLQWELNRVADREGEVLKRFDVEAGGYVLSTIHRAENTTDAGKLQTIIDGLRRTAAEGIDVLLLAHPRTRQAISENSLTTDGVRLMSPAVYGEMICLQKNARAIATDSGGMQKEAFWLAVPCITLRETTEWPETVEAGWNVLPRLEPHEISASILSAARGQDRPDLYGDGTAALRIVRHLAEANQEAGT